ncbi:MAG TPA: hypothetical protein VLH39_04565 [Magnetospirillaceae bacterium]|nr:hypothetical protein [Magnetospirillaceae bacterium]
MAMSPVRPRPFHYAVRGGWLALLAAGVLGSCAGRVELTPRRDGTHGPVPGGRVRADSVAYAAAERDAFQIAVVAGGLSLVGRTELVVDGVRFPMDCTGVVRAAYAFGGMDLAFRFASYRGNGVRRLYLTLRDEDLLYSSRHPAPGDLVFWDHTYDANGNLSADDELTHVGMVVGMDPDGTIAYLHHNYRRGPVVERMNLARPDQQFLIAKGVSRRINYPIRLRGSPPGPGTTAAELFRVFGAAYRLPR